MKTMKIVSILMAIVFLFSCAERVTYKSQFDEDDLIPVFEPPGGNFYNQQIVSIDCKQEDVIFRFTTDGTAPSDTSEVYTEPIVITANTLLKAKSYKNGWIFKTAETQYNLTPTTPTFDPPAGTYSESQTVTMNCATDGATIYYTTNGDDPTKGSTKYTTPIDITETTTLKAIAFKDGWTASETATALYTISDIPIVAAPTFDPPEGVYSALVKDRKQMGASPIQGFVIPCS